MQMSRQETMIKSRPTRRQRINRRSICHGGHLTHGNKANFSSKFSSCPTGFANTSKPVPPRPRRGERGGVVASLSFPFAPVGRPIQKPGATFSRGFHLPPSNIEDEEEKEDENDPNPRHCPLVAQADQTCLVAAEAAETFSPWSRLSAQNPSFSALFTAWHCRCSADSEKFA